MNKYIIGVGFLNSKLSYFEHDTELEIGQEVVCETSLGFEIGRVQAIRIMEEKDEQLFPQIIRIATIQDMSVHTKNLSRCEKIVTMVQELSDELKLNMCVISASLSLDDSKVLITYTAEDRVDFRELLKLLSSQLRCRIELRQIGPRDKAKLVGGIGVCGLQLCCSTFLDSFDGISISMAKNQMLSLNIPKLSGQCGKLMCCLKYEDEAYVELRKEFPTVGTRVKFENKDYVITGINVLSGNATISDSETIVTTKVSNLKIQNRNDAKTN